MCMVIGASMLISTLSCMFLGEFICEIINKNENKKIKIRKHTKI